MEYIVIGLSVLFSVVTLYAINKRNEVSKLKNKLSFKEYNFDLLKNDRDNWKQSYFKIMQKLEKTEQKLERVIKENSTVDLTYEHTKIIKSVESPKGYTTVGNQSSITRNQITEDTTDYITPIVVSSLINSASSNDDYSSKSSCDYNSYSSSDSSSYSCSSDSSSSSCSCD